MSRATLIVFAIALGGCRLASNNVAPLSCYDPIIVRCTACVDRGCGWCPAGPNTDEGYCCDRAHVGASHCPSPITDEAQCVRTPPCDELAIGTCDDCLGRGCGWCGGDTTQCHSRGSDGQFPHCEGGGIALSGPVSVCPP